MRTVILLLSVVLAGMVPAAAQTPAGGPPPPAPVDNAPVPPPDYTYESASRRDPFVSLVDRGADAREPQVAGARPDGLPGVLVEEVVVRGILQSRGGWIAMIAAPTGRTHTARPGDRLMDGTVRSITAQMVVLLQDVNDPLSREKHREVRKYLRGEVK